MTFRSKICLAHDVTANISKENWAQQEPHPLKKDEHPPLSFTAKTWQHSIRLKPHDSGQAAPCNAKLHQQKTTRKKTKIPTVT